mmetsp:Transcript_20615/g.28808  ORF Transcript_20615/g.28808 Transcript_20615/m.28808 type:complete len:80 (-) Transcript_20615:520-759(-)
MQHELDATPRFHALRSRASTLGRKTRSTAPPLKMSAAAPPPLPQGVSPFRWDYLGNGEEGVRRSPRHLEMADHALNNFL